MFENLQNAAKDISVILTGASATSLGHAEFLGDGTPLYRTALLGLTLASSVVTYVGIMRAQDSVPNYVRSLKGE